MAISVTRLSRRAMRSEIAAILRPAGGYVDLDPMSVDLPGQSGRVQAISIENGSVAMVDCDSGEDCYWRKLSSMPVVDLRELLTAARWSRDNDGLEIAKAEPQGGR